jgi:hypothetical protein
VTGSVHAVFSEPPAGVSDEEFNAWYDGHVLEILSVPGFASVRRFRLEPVVVNPDGPIAYRYLALYEIEGDPADALARLEQAGMGSKDSYSTLKDAGDGELPLPEWFERIAFASCNCFPVGGCVEAGRTGP